MDWLLSEEEAGLFDVILADRVVGKLEENWGCVTYQKIVDGYFHGITADTMRTIVVVKLQKLALAAAVGE